jgi:anti-sigma regulatory factor (Ser/Thr protein kinase)
LPKIGPSENERLNFWQELVNGRDFMPRRYCGVWSPSLIALHIVSDVLIWLAYLWIPLVMVWAYRAHRRDLRLHTPMFLIFLLYTIFITACGWTHFFDALMFINPVYRLNGAVRAVTAIVSVATAVSLIRLVPRAITAPIKILAQQAAITRQQAWLRDILDAATGGVLRLCFSSSQLPARLAGRPVERAVDSPNDLTAVRKMAQHLAEEAGFDRSRSQDLITSVHEAAMNTLRHAGGGTVRGYREGDRVQIWVEDQGPGIPLDRLPIATLKQGYSTAGTAGQGWFQVLSLADAAYLCTSAGGTAVVLEMACSPSPPLPFSVQVGGDVRV